MKLPRFLILAATLICSALAQQPKSTTSIKDALATALVERALAAMGLRTGVDLPTDAELRGSIVFAGQSYPITIWAKGTSKARVEVIRPDGTSTRILNSGRAISIKPNGKRRELLTNNTLGERVTHVPALSLLAEYASQTINIEREDSSDLKGLAQRVKLSLHAQDANSDIVKKVTTRKYLVDEVSALVTAMEYTSYSEIDMSDESTVNIRYSEYKQIDQLLVPFRQETYVDGELSEALTLESVKFNSGVPESLFNLEGGK